MRTDFKNFLSCVLVLFVFISCENKKAEQKENIKKDGAQTIKTANEPKAVVNKKYNDVALFLGGIKVDKTSEYYNLTSTYEWEKYSYFSKIKWEKFNSTKTTKIQAWSSKELQDVYNNKEQTIFYPFSGPDILHALNFFPNAKKFILFGLEPVGTIPDFRKFPKDSLGSFYSLLNSSINDALSLSFFKTKDMCHELNNKEIDGTIQVLLLFLARTNNEIVDIKPLDISEDGTIKYVKNYIGFTGKRGLNKGVEISFKTKNTNILKKVFYYSADLSNSGLERCKNVKLFLGKIEGNLCTFIKSASYLMHKPYFSIIRNTVLNNSQIILQDDSGIGFHYFDKKLWSIKLYGTYTEPIQMFINLKEDDLKEAYTQNTQPLDFRIGYGRKSNLLLARKK